jgi:predicted Zn-dependent protease
VTGSTEFITVYDAEGRPVEIDRTAWVTQVLPATLKREWDNPGHLAALITSGLRDGFADELRDAARRLLVIDPDPEHAALLRAVVELRSDDPAEAERILMAFLATNPPSGLVLTNLAKAQVGLGRTQEAEATLTNALDLDPNQENGLDWMVAIHRERGGPDAVLAILTRLAARPGAWRPQMLLARAAPSRGPARGPFA